MSELGVHGHTQVFIDDSEQVGVEVEIDTDTVTLRLVLDTDTDLRHFARLIRGEIRGEFDVLRCASVAGTAVECARESTRLIVTMSIEPGSDHASHLASVHLYGEELSSVVAAFELAYAELSTAPDAP